MAKKPELRRSRRASGEGKTCEIAFDALKEEWRRVEASAYTCCFCGRLMGGIGYRSKDRTACPEHLDDTRGVGPPPPAPPMTKPIPAIVAAQIPPAASLKPGKKKR